MRQQRTILLQKSKDIPARVPRKSDAFNLPVRLIRDQTDDCSIVHQDGSISRIIQFEPNANHLWKVEQFALCNKVIVDWLQQQQLDIQLVVVSKRTPAEALVRKFSNTEEQLNEYLVWMQTYQTKWLERLSEIGAVFEKHFYLIVSQPSDTKCGDNTVSLQPASTKLKRLEQKCALVTNALARLSSPATVLNYDETRTVLHNELNFGLAFMDEVPSPPDSAVASGIPHSLLAEETHTLTNAKGLARCGYLSQLPLTTTPTWLADVINLPLSYVLSVHVSQMNQAQLRKKLLRTTNLSAEVAEATQAVIGGDERAVKLSMCISVVARELPELHKAERALKNFFMARGALFTIAENSQLPGYLSCLPMGRNFLQAGHFISARSAANFFALPGDRPGTSDGIYLGSSPTSAQTIRYDLFDQQKPSNLLICGNDTRQTERLMATLLLRWIAWHNVIFVGRTSPYKYLHQLLGNDLAAVRKFMCPMQVVADIDNSRAFKSLTLLDTRAEDEAQFSGTEILQNLTELIENHAGHSNRRLAMVLDDSLARLLAEEELANRLSRLAKERGIALVFLAPSVIDEPKRAAFALLHARCDGLFVLEQPQNQVDAVVECFGLSAADRTSLLNRAPDLSEIGVLINTPRGTSRIRFRLSPMERWLAGLSPTHESQRSVMMVEVLEANPSLNFTDTCRQAVYYLGLRT